MFKKLKKKKKKKEVRTCWHRRPLRLIYGYQIKEKHFLKKKKKKKKKEKERKTEWTKTILKNKKYINA